MFRSIKLPILNGFPPFSMDTKYRTATLSMLKKRNLILTCLRSQYERNFTCKMDD